MTDSSNKEWVENRARLEIASELFAIDCERAELQRQIRELDKKELRLLGLHDDDNKNP